MARPVSGEMSYNGPCAMVKHPLRHRKGRRPRLRRGTQQPSWTWRKSGICESRDVGAKSSENHGAPGKIRTPNLLIRSQVLYPVELRALMGRDRPGR